MFRHYGHRREIETLSSPLGRHFGKFCHFKLQVLLFFAPCPLKLFQFIDIVVRRVKYFRRGLRLRQLAAADHRQGGGRPVWPAWKEVQSCFVSQDNYLGLERQSCLLNANVQTILFFPQGGTLATRALHRGKPGVELARRTRLSWIGIEWNLRAITAISGNLCDFMEHKQTCKFHSGPPKTQKQMFQSHVIKLS